MCGIGGWIKKNPRKFSMEDILYFLKLMIEIQDRGTEAFGIYYTTKKGGNINKSPGSVNKYFSKTSRAKKAIRTLLNTQLLLGHTRFSTQGDPKRNINNHPFSTADFVFAHNGQIYNHEELRKKYPAFKKWHDKIETDSYALLLAIQHKFKEMPKNKNRIGRVGEAIKLACDEVSGNVASWLLDKKTNDLYLFRNTNPCFIYKTTQDFVFSSELSHLTKTFSLKREDVASIKSGIVYVLDKKNFVLKALEDIEINPYNWHRQHGMVGDIEQTDEIINWKNGNQIPQHAETLRMFMCDPVVEEKMERYLNFFCLTFFYNARKDSFYFALSGADNEMIKKTDTILRYKCRAKSLPVGLSDYLIRMFDLKRVCIETRTIKEMRIFMDACEESIRRYRDECQKDQRYNSVTRNVVL